MIVPQAIHENPDDTDFKVQVTSVFTCFRQELLTLLNNSQMHIYLFALKDSDKSKNRFRAYYYTDIFFDPEGKLLDLQAIKDIFNHRLMGVFYKVIYSSYMFMVVINTFRIGLLPHSHLKEIIC